MTVFRMCADYSEWPRFGDFAVVEQKRHGVSNEMYYHKVVATLVSNSWVDVPVQSPATETLHDSSERVAIVICCGVDESRTYRVRVADLHKVEVAARPSEAMSGWIKCSDRLPPAPGSYLTHSPQSPYPVHIGVWLSHEQAWEHEWHRKKRSELKPRTWITHWHELPAIPTE